MDWFADNGWLAWVGLALVLAAVEVATVTFFFLMLAGGAVAGAVAAAAGMSLSAQVVVSVVAALLLTLVVRPPLVRRLARHDTSVRFGAAANVGREALVLEQVSATGGRVKLTGEDWSARSADASLIPPGHVVRVVSLDGATAIVVPVAPAGAPAERM